MRILLSNDDGYLSEGIQVMNAALRQIADVTLVAPDRNQSCSSQSLTLSRPLRVHAHGNQVYSVDGTPSDCVNLAVNGLFDTPPDLVVSGINDGPNLGDDVIYSGTVAAAIEGRHLGLPSIAVSMASWNPQHYQSAAQVVVAMLEKTRLSPPRSKSVLNINVPDLPYSQLKGMVATRLGYRHQSGPIVHQQDPRGRDIYWIGPAGEVLDDSEGTDFHAIAQQRVSVTPLQVDLTAHRLQTPLNHWLEGVL